MNDFEEKLKKAGIQCCDESEFPEIILCNFQAIRRFFILYSGEDGVSVECNITIGDDILAFMKAWTLEKLQQILEEEDKGVGEVFKSAQELLKEVEQDTKNNDKIAWIDEVEKLLNNDYIEGILQKVEETHPAKIALLLKEKYGLDVQFEISYSEELQWETAFIRYSIKK